MNRDRNQQARIDVASARFLEMLRSGSDQAVAWDRDVRDIPVTADIPRLYEEITNRRSPNHRLQVYVGNYNSSQPVYTWIADSSDSLGGKWFPSRQQL